MPVRKYKKGKRGSRRYRKRSYRGKSFRYNASLSNSLGMPGLPNGKVVVMPYHDQVRWLTSSLGSHALMGGYRVNGLYDPYIPTGGAQPLSHDEYANHYNKYCVLGAKVTTTFMWTQPSDAGNGPVLCFSWLDSDNTAPTTYSTKRERYGNKCKILQADPSKSVTIVNYFSAKKWFKVKDPLDDHQSQATFGMDPTKTIYNVVGVQSVDSGVTSGIVMIQQRIDYIVKLLDPKPILGS